MPTLLLFWLAYLGVFKEPLVRFLAKWTLGLLVVLSVVAGGVAVLRGLIELVTGIPFHWLSARWDALTKWQKLGLGVLIYLLALGIALWLLRRQSGL